MNEISDKVIYQKQQERTQKKRRNESKLIFFIKN